ncbi:MAG: hypothetical protein JW746_01815 [Candidatus Krumholzibacteriota bacterium]|nr:hypothetical protein [Candidatus Krumholzibacteriota bacterium]
MAAASTYKLIGKGDPEQGHTSFFMMNNLLYSRIDSGYPSNNDQYDEDVNVYLAGLLESLISPEYHRNLKKYVIPYDLPLFESIEGETDSRVKYMTYRVNADFLLISIGLFDGVKGRASNSVPYMNIPERSYIGRGKAYYDLARSYLLQTTLHSTAMTEILGKLSDNFEKYLKIISVMKSEHFNFIRRISEGELYHLSHDIERDDLKKRTRLKYDEFLDAYSRFRKEKSTESKTLLQEKMRELKKLDGSFEFDPDLAGPSDIPDEI